MTDSVLDHEVATILAQPYLDYAEPLRIAWEWNRSGDEHQLRKAEQLLARLTEPGQFPFALPVWYERALNLVKQKRPEAALVLLGTISREFGEGLDEDTLSLWGRLHKDAGDVALGAGRMAEAAQTYALAEDAYARAYQLRKDRFPGINLATLQFVRAGLLKSLDEQPTTSSAGRAIENLQPTALREEAVKLLRTARGLAADILATSGTWQVRLADDRIWMAATRAEANVLLGKWDLAAEEFRAALDPRNAPKPFHAESMKAQLRRLIAAYNRLGEAPPPPFDNIDTFFSSHAAT